ncbi:DNA-binding protein [Mucilaginibacter sp. CAU 1740]|uniref:DNA-binding protein n=1 Tax=Mucilaginibacter sp. CAU 1740 TaxID=3140365 RepID=UPI00325A6AC2
MNVELITKGDLQEFKSDLLNEIKRIIQPGQASTKKWLKSVEVRKLLGISPGTLRFTKVGSIMYYKLEDINKILEGEGK